jgi:hypothetical protein
MPVTADIIPDTPTARALAGRSEQVAIEATECKPKRYIVADPDAPDAPTCSGKRYITVDPDDPDAPTCSGKRYIVAPDPAGRTRAEALPAWARAFGDSLAESKR